MWTQGWRENVWSQLEREFDLIVIGGGITGAGILREATLPPEPRAVHPSLSTGGCAT